MKLAIVGLGHVAQYQLDALASVPELTLVAACDHDPGKRLILPGELPFYTSVDALIEGAEADIFLVSTPSDTHFHIADKLLSEGQNVAIEKPVCLSRAELDVLAEYSKKSFVYALFHTAFGPELEFWKRHQHEYHLGDLQSFACGFYDPYVVNNKLREQAIPLIGSWVDSGINALSVIGSLVPPEYIECDSGYIRHVDDAEESVSKLRARFKFAYGRTRGTGDIDTSWISGLNSKITILTYQRGEVVLNHSERFVSLHTNDQNRRLMDVDSQTPRLTEHYQAMFRDIVSRYRVNNSNFGFAFRLHELFLQVQEPITQR